MHEQGNVSIVLNTTLGATKGPDHQHILVGSLALLNDVVFRGLGEFGANLFHQLWHQDLFNESLEDVEYILMIELALYILARVKVTHLLHQHVLLCVIQLETHIDKLPLFILNDIKEEIAAFKTKIVLHQLLFAHFSLRLVLCIVHYGL
jgi:hypothetical protein